MQKQLFVLIAMICIVAIVIALVRIKPSAKIKKKPVLIGIILLSSLLLLPLLLLNPRDFQDAIECYSDGRWGPESPEVAKNLSSGDRMAIVEYIRDHIRGARHSGNDRVPDPDDRVYVIYGNKGWQSASGLITEADSEKISLLLRPENDVPAYEHAYNIRFQCIKADLVCVGVHHKYSPFYPTRSHGFYDYIWVFEKSFFGTWELFTILDDGIV